MSILIKMEMPRGCYQCLFMTHCEECEGHPNHCILDEDEHGFGKHLFSNLEWKYPIVPMERPSWCPLIELPPHGRLIDADALKEKVKELLSPKNTKGVLETMGAMFRYVLDAPTIIEADENRTN